MLTMGSDAWNIVETHVSGEQRVTTERAPFTLVVGMQHNRHIFERHHNRQRPEYDGKDLKEVIIGGQIGECTRVDI